MGSMTLGDWFGTNRFQSKVCRADDCWTWIGGRKPTGYGTFYVAGSGMVAAHRIALSHALGRNLADGEHALHRCDNPSCVKPSHLFPGTHADNMRDRGEKGRTSHTRGERQGNAKLTEAQVIAIRDAYKAGSTQTALADAFGVSQSLISVIVRGEAWRHVAVRREEAA